MKPLALILALSIVGMTLPAAAVDLPTALQAAQANDPTFASARSNRDAATENVAITRSRLLPQVSFQSTIQHLNQTTVQSGTPHDFSGQSRNSTLSLRQGVYRPRDWAGAAVGELQAQYGQYQFGAAQSDVWNRAVGVWIDVLGSQTLRDHYARSVESATNSAEQEKRRLQAGDGTRDAVAEAVAVLAQARAQLADAELDLKSKEQAFRLLTRLDPASFRTFRLPEADKLALPVPSEAEMLSRVLDNSAELQGARIAEAVAQKRLDQVSSDHRPTLDMIGSVSRAENDATNTLGLKYNNHQIGVQLVVPIYSGGGVSATQRQAAAQYAAATTDREAVEQKLRTQVAVDWNAQVGLRERALAAKELVASAREQRRAAERGIRAGLRTWTEASAADQLIARRGADQTSLLVGIVKTQAKLLALLPVSDPAWDEWSRALSALAIP